MVCKESIILFTITEKYPHYPPLSNCQRKPASWGVGDECGLRNDWDLPQFHEIFNFPFISKL